MESDKARVLRLHNNGLTAFRISQMTNIPLLEVSRYIDRYTDDNDILGAW